MSADQGAWTEFAFRAPACSHAGLVADVVGPFLTAALADGIATGGIFLRELGSSDRPRLSVQVREAADAGAGPELAERFRLLVDAANVTDVGTGAVASVPLAGSVFGGNALGAVTRRFLAEVNSVLLELACAGTAGRAALLAGALDLMAAHLPAVADSGAPGASGAAEVLNGAPLSFLSFRSHAEAFIATSRDPAAARRALDERYEAARATVEGRVSTILAEMREERPTAASRARQWYEAVRHSKPEIAEYFHGGDLVAHSEPAGDRLSGEAGFSGSSFHRIAESSARLQRFLGHDPRFLAVRLLTSLLYLSLHTVGVSLAERYFLCHATSRACESLFDVDVLTVLSALARG